MRLYGVMMMRNEADVLESWVRYHVQLFDRLMIADHLSADGSLDLARELRDEGLPVDLYVTRNPAYAQSGLVTYLAREAIGRGADWVFPLDADEFLNTSGTSPVDHLRDLDPETPLSIPWRTYVPSETDPPNEPRVPSRITWRLQRESRPFTKVAIPSESLRHASVSVSTGSHRLVKSGNRVGTASPPDEWSIAHFPVRSVEQLAAKAFVGWISMLASPHRQPGASYQWRIWYETLLDADLTSLNLTELAIGYLAETQQLDRNPPLIRDPLPLCHFDMHSGPGPSVSPLKAFASAAEAIAIELAEVRKGLDHDFIGPPAYLDRTS